MQTVVCRADPQNLSVVPRQPLILVPIRDVKMAALSTLMSQAPSTSRGPRPILPRTTPQRPPPECSSSEGAAFTPESSTRGWATARGEQLRKKIEQLPSRERLLNQHILLSDGRVAPLIEQRARLLRQDRIRRNLSRKLEARPGPLELVTRKILQADADLEQAIEEGRVLFQPTSEHVEEEESEMPSPLSTDMEIVSQAAIRSQNKPINVLSNKGIIRKKSTPYKHCDPLPLRAKTKAPDSKEDDEVTVIGEVCSPSEQTTKNSDQNSYELLLQQQKLFLQWQQNDEGTTQAQDTHVQMFDMQQPSSPTSTTPPNQVIIRRLSDYKVQELKNECKKRQLPVSGAKPQLLERLRPFEKAILGATPPSTPEPPQYSNSSTDTSTPASSAQEVQQQPQQQHQQQPQQLTTQRVLTGTYATNVKGAGGGGGGGLLTDGTIDDTTNWTVAVHHEMSDGDYYPPIEQSPRATAQPVVQERNTVGIRDCLGRPLLFQLAPPLVQLTDAKGAPVGLASVQYISGSAHPVVLTYNRAGPHQSNGQTVTSVQQPGSTSPNAPEGIRIIPIEKGALNPQTTKVIATTATSTLSQPRVVQATQVVQKQNDNTFRFAQMGSGGQFTVAQPTERSPNKGTPLVMKTAGPSHAILATPKHSITNIIGLNQQSAQMATTGVHQSSAPVLVAFQPTTSAYQAPQPQNTTEINSAQSTIVQNGFAHNAPLNPCLQGSPRTADLAGNSPHMPNSGQSETVAETGDGTVENPITFDDPSAILTPAVLSMHEEMLRAQQKKIELLLEELTKSQANLKHEQQLILTAKKAQQRLREQQRENASNREREQWLKELDVGHINKQHIQHFIQHRKQQASLQRHTLEHNRLTTTEARLQEELHVEQAVQDIVRLIKQDPRTALLIVQLLRRYQLERNAEQQQANSPDDEKTSQADSPASDEQETLEQSYEMPTQSFEPKPNVVEDDQQVRLESVIICDASGMQLHHDQSVMYHQNNGLMEESKQLTVDMEEIFKTVIEDASRAMGNCNTTAQSIDCTVTNNVQQSQQTVVVCGQQWQQPGVMFQNCVQPQQEVHITTNSGMNAVQPTQMMTTNDNSYEEALHEQSPQMGYSQDMEDLMAVLRDDQDCGNKPGSFQMDLGVGYGSEELAGLIGDDWLDCADRNIGNNGQYAPYISESHGSVGGRSTDPMCMNSHSDDGIEQNMDWLDVVLQNTPIEERPYGSN